MCVRKAHLVSLFGPAGKKQNGTRRSAIPACTARFLEVGFN